MNNEVNLNQIYQELEAFRKQIDAGKAEVTRAETNKENLMKQLNEAIAQLRNLGIDPDNAVTELGKMDQELLQGMNKIRELLNPPENPNPEPSFQLPNEPILPGDSSGRLMGGTP